MHLTKKTDYCVRVLIYLQNHKGRVKIKDIAEAYKISKNHLSVAVNKLAELDYIITTQGPKGGIEFNKASENKTIGSVITEIEDLNIVECFDLKNNNCNLSPDCKLKGMLAKSTAAFVAELNKYKIKDLK